MRALASVGCGENTIKLWDAETGRKLCTLHGHKETIRALAFNRKRSILASADSGTTVKLWRIPKR
ncbi:hypothetical protein DRO42_07810 [Candidatus Bathyarchaeota archaeon]|nr:MAG: hypothetical protein DRO42_07810 [Candidatus Bathyarchaeota archaeon]